KDPRGGVGLAAEPQTVVLDYSSPNVAKRLHVGHLRSTIIGEAMKRILAFLGHKAIADNHVGDWGTQYGLLITAFRRWADEEALQADPIGHLEALYQKASATAKEDPEFAAEGRRELAKLHQGDPENLALWKRFVDLSRADVEELYDMLDVTFDHWLGESFYHEYLDDLVKRLEAEGLAREDQGALVIFFEGDADLEETPFLIRKQDGAFLYSTTDLATLEYRLAEWKPDRILYFVDRRQSLHFKQLFAAARRMGIETVELEHISFGSIMNKEGRPLKTREGGTPSLRALLQEGVDAARELLKANRPDFSDEQIERVAKAVGIGAIKYADLSQNRNTDYKFDLAKMIAFEGDTGPYLQYTYARISSIFRKLETPWTAPETIQLTHPDEIALARHLVRFEETLAKAGETCMPNYLCDYLFNLAKSYSTFYTNCPILKSEGAVRETRLALCRAVQHQLAAGLTCLGIEPLEEM
ncbi:MAG: arginine--tRNA ligase, partial [Candidatus Sericytochromatia bacterium]